MKGGKEEEKKENYGVGVGVTLTNGRVSSDSGAMEVTTGAVKVTVLVPPTLATLLATAAAAQTFFLTKSPRRPMAVAAVTSMMSHSFWTLPWTAPMAWTIQMSVETWVVRVRMRGSGVRSAGLDPAQMISCISVTL